MEKRMKTKFLNEYAHDLLVANEETAMCLEKLNKNDFFSKKLAKVKRRKRRSSSSSKYDDDDDDNEESEAENLENLIEFDDNENDDPNHDDYDEEDEEEENKNTDKTNALLFIDYSIIKFNRIVNILKDLYENEMAISKPVLKLSANPNPTNLTANNNFNNDIENDSSLSPSSSSSSSTFQIKKTIAQHRADSRKSSKAKSFLENEKVKLLACTPESNSKDEVSTNNSNKISSNAQSLVTSVSANVAAAANTNNNNNTSGSTMHSRNACKKLKCPKCNWHYKYHETLDIHMKEKHSTDLANTLTQQCVYCLENAQHPRLGRGEQYKCGYKPYRCDICDYSTTTKGNLSIHMQSDKHMNNIKDGGGVINTNTNSQSTDNKLVSQVANNNNNSTSDLLVNGLNQQRLTNINNNNNNNNNSSAVAAACLPNLKSNLNSSLGKELKKII
jgi:hypothetical protein